MITTRRLGTQSFIRHFKYDWETHCLTLTFQNQKTYRYHVSQSVFESFSSSMNKGQYYNQYIKKSTYPNTH